MKKEIIFSKLNPLFFKGICHRGLHNSELTENGLKAFKNALDHKMTIELDIHLTKDNQLVVFHDSETKRVTGKEGIIENLTLAEIKNNYRLLDGEDIPTFNEVLSMINEQIPIVVELKVYQRNYKRLAAKALEALSVIKDKKNIMIISFDPRALLFIGKTYIRQLLVAHDGKHEYTYIFRHFFEGVDLDYKFLKEKKYQKYCKKHFSNTWTIESKEVFNLVYGYVDTVTFQLMDEGYVYHQLENKKQS